MRSVNFKGRPPVVHASWSRVSEPDANAAQARANASGGVFGVVMNAWDVWHGDEFTDEGIAPQRLIAPAV